MEPNDKKPWLIPGDEGGGDRRRAAPGESGELLKAKKKWVPWSVKSQHWWSKNRSRESLGYCLYCFLKGLLSWGPWKLRIISLGYCCVETMSYALSQLQLLCSLLSLGTLSQRLGQSIQEIMETRKALWILEIDDGNLGGRHWHC